MSTRGSEAWHDDHWNLYHDVMDRQDEAGQPPLYLEIHPRYVEQSGQDGLDVTITLPPDLARVIRAGIAKAGGWVSMPRMICDHAKKCGYGNCPAAKPHDCYKHDSVKVFKCQAVRAKVRCVKAKEV